ncbi:MAG TPA: VIT1/CCC1 transporter family protein, partial [Actinomycetota bacterium]|nr:VIT1/CCC1 transporter family protein [Actinomycetota bacterium]
REGLGNRLRGRSGSRISPHPGPVGAEQNASSSKSGALRAAIFGMNDGLVSNLSLIFGVAGAEAAADVVVIAGFAGLLAGAFSMGAGEYVSMKVQREVFEQLIHKEAHEIASQPAEELRELAEIYERKGISPETAARIAAEIMDDPELALETHAREELGIDMKEGLGSPWAAAGSSFATFSVGAVVPLLPFLFTSDETAIVVSAGLSAVTLFAVGGAMTILTGRGVLLSGARMLAIGAVAAAITYGVGSLVGVAVG